MRAPRRRSGAVCALLLWAAVAPAAGDDQLARVARQIDAARFDDADAELGRLLASGTLERRELSRAHLLAGVLAAARRDETNARASFRRALSLEPSIALPGSAGPHVSAAFDQAKSELGAAPGLGVAVEGGQPRTGAAATVRVVVSGDSERIARRLRVQAGSFRQERPLPPLEQTVDVPAPESGCTDVAAAVLDRSGNRLWSTPSALRVCAGSDSASAQSTASTPLPSAGAEPPLGAPIWIGLGLTAVGVAATGALGVIALDQRADYHSLNDDASASVGEREAARDDASAAQRRATVAAIATAAVGAATLTLYLLRPRASSTEIGVRVHEGGAGAVLGGRF